jgi:hypothetical protein
MEACQRHQLDPLREAVDLCTEEKGCLHVVRMEAKTAAKPAQN